MLKLLAAEFSEIIEKSRKKMISWDAEVSGGAGAINAICSRLEVADDVISGYNVYSFSSFPENQNQPPM